MALFFILIPITLGIFAFFFTSNRLRPLLLPFAGALHFIGTLATLALPSLAYTGSWLFLDAPAKLVLILLSTLFLLCSLYAVAYLRIRIDQPNAVFCLSLLGFLGIASMVIWSQHLGLLWIAIEGTTLITAPLIIFNHGRGSLEATWKYLLLCSVGIAIALLGTFFLAYSALLSGGSVSLLLPDLLARAPYLSKPWLHAAFALLLLGYGTKMGLSPMHTWKPDAYGEAPGLAGALLAGGVTSCAFLALLRIYQITHAAGSAAFIAPMLITVGLVSMATAAIFMIGQRDFKRMLAYSSVEHMGILVAGLGFGAAALAGVMLHLLVNALTKGVLFLSVGNIHRAYNSKNTEQVTGALRRLPLSASLFLVGFFAIAGSPPFGPFISILGILDGAVANGHIAAAAIFVALLLLVFIGMGATVLKVVQGAAPDRQNHSNYQDSPLSTWPILALLLLVIILGVTAPAPITSLVQNAATTLAGG